MHAPSPRVRHDGDGRREGSSGAFTHPVNVDIAAVVALLAELEQRPASSGDIIIRSRVCGVL
jgi:hypothetical protein